MSTFRRGTIAVVALALTLTVASCTDKPAALDPTSSSSNTASTTPDPTPTAVAAPERPEAMNTASVDGAVAAATYFMDLYTYARQTGDLTEWNAFSANDCQFCNAVISGVEDSTAAEHVVRGAEIQVLESTGSDVDGTLFSAQLRVREAAAQEFDQSGAVVAAGAGAEHDLLVALSWDSGAWTVRAIDVHPTPTAAP